MRASERVASLVPGAVRGGAGGTSTIAVVPVVSVVTVVAVVSAFGGRARESGKAASELRGRSPQRRRVGRVAGHVAGRHVAAGRAVEQRPDVRVPRVERLEHRARLRKHRLVPGEGSVSSRQGWVSSQRRATVK